MISDFASAQHGASRREFLRGAISVAAAMMITNAGCTKASNAVAGQGPIPMRPLGRTGLNITTFGLGGQATIEMEDKRDEALRIVSRALDLGVNYFDTAAGYRSGVSETQLGEALDGHRNEIILASKSRNRTRDGAWRDLEASLKRLRTDHLDIWQIHNIKSAADVEQVFAKGGAIEAFQQARDQKLTRFLGVTGHADPELLMECIRRFPFDTILLAINAADKHYLSFGDKLLPLCMERNMGIIAMKVPARGRILWQPFKQLLERRRPGKLDMREAYHYVLTLPVSGAIIGCDTVAHLEQNTELARTFRPLTVEQMLALESKVKPIYEQALYFRGREDNS